MIWPGLNIRAFFIRILAPMDFFHYLSGEKAPNMPTVEFHEYIEAMLTAVLFILTVVAGVAVICAMFVAYVNAWSDTEPMPATWAELRAKTEALRPGYYGSPRDPDVVMNRNDKTGDWEVVTFIRDESGEVRDWDREEIEWELEAERPAKHPEIQLEID